MISNAYRIYFVLLHALLKTPLLRRFVLSLHITASTYRGWSNAERVDARGAESPPGCLRQYLRTYRRVRLHMRAAPTRPAVFMVYEPRLHRVVSQLHSHGIDVLMIGRGLFDFLFQQRLREYLMENARGFGEYALEAYERYGADRSRYLRDCTYIADLMKRCFALQWIILPKYNDDYTLEMVQAFHDAGWTTVVYDREGTVTKKRLEMIPTIVARQAPQCDVVMTYNQTHKAFFEKVFQLASVPKPEIVVMGNPASDDWFQNSRSQNGSVRTGGGRQILYFAFGEFSYVFDTKYLSGKEEVWRALLTDIHDALAEHLRYHPNDQLLYKRGAKGNRDYWRGSERLLALENARLVPNTASANALIVESDVVIAFQTTALIDAMHTDKVLIYCAWGDRYEELKGGLIDFEEFARAGAILHARSAAEFRQMLALQSAEVQVNLAARKRIRESFTANPDGMVASRFADWLSARVRAN